MKCSCKIILRVAGWISMAIAASVVTAYAQKGAARAQWTDYAVSRHVGDWLRHPVLGDPSFDAFERVSGNFVHRGKPPYEWPVNAFYFADPVSGNWYAYIGQYGIGYLSIPSRCLLYRSQNRGRTWENLGVVLQGDAALFDRGGHTPDVSVVYEAGRYHLLYDWGEKDFNQEGGLAYAWAERPEGPFHRDMQPLTRNSALPLLLDRYRRTYAGTLIRRKRDWLILGMTDHAPHSWAMFAMTAPRPGGPYGKRVLLRNVEADTFHPPLMEFYPAFVHDGYVYAPATSVALNRDFNALYRAPLERADDPSAWVLTRYGSLWHSEDTENEHYGLWGQTFSGMVEASGVFWALFPSRDRQGMGTINLARRAWNRPLRARGFVLSGHQGPSFTLLRRAYRAYTLQTTLKVRGAASLLLDYHGLLGPDLPQADARPHPLAHSHLWELALTRTTWQAVHVAMDKTRRVVAEGVVSDRAAWNLTLTRRAGGTLIIASEGKTLWQGALQEEAPGRGNSVPLEEETDAPGSLGLWVEPNASVEVQRFRVYGVPRSAAHTWLYTEALLGHGENPAHWEERTAAAFHAGIGAVAKMPNARAKWNVLGTGCTLYSPRGPEYGAVEV